MIKRNPFLLLVLLALVSHPLWAAIPTVDSAQLVPTPKEQLATVLITKVIDRYHYKKTPLDDALSASVLDRYLESLDPNRRIFLQQDIAAFSKYKTRLDDSLRSAHLEPAFDIFRTYRTRLEQRVNYAVALLDRGFNFQVDENFLFDRRKAPWAADRTELNEIWRKRVKNDVLTLRLTGKKEDEIKDTLRKRYERLTRSTEQMKGDDVYQIFMNAYTESVEPHTAYFSPRTSEDFKINMSLSLEGIGAALRSVNEFTVVQQVITGGPADLSGQLHSDDRIIGVGQGRDGKFTDVIGWRLEDVVDLIRGPKGSVVRLQILSKGKGPEGPSKVVTLVRDKVKLEEQAAKKYLIENANGKGTRIGVIEVPTFYLDFDGRARGDKDFRSTTRDVRKLLAELVSDGVDGIVIDLRGNGGGSLAEATSMAGLFIRSGPVVQVKDASGQIEINEDPDPSIAYSGPLAVLVDRHSASASEIFAGAIQDYHRGIIIGEPTYGKGTVQTLIDLDRFVQSSGDSLGQLKITMAQFFRISGDSTQLRGVRPDIVFPTVADPDDQGERGMANALPWAKVRPAKFTPKVVSLPALDEAKARHDRRVKSDPGFRFLLSEARSHRSVMERNSVSLLESKRREEQKATEKQQRDQENRFLIAQGMKPIGDGEASETELNKKLEKVWVYESANILGDYVMFSRPRSVMETAPN
jgi:carboxyl-terminal processing protease